MDYRLSDLIEKLINIEENALELYGEIQKSLKNQSNKVISIIIDAIRKEELKHIKYYKELKIEVENSINENIDFYLYDKVAKILFEFKNQNIVPQINNVQELIKFAFEFEKNNIALLINIQGRLIQKEDDINKYTYKILDKIIKEEEKHEKMFEKLIISKN